MIPTAKEKQGIAARLRLQPNEQPQAADGSALGKPTIKLEFESNEQLQEFFKEHEENLIDSYAETVDPDERPDYSRPALQGYGDVYQFRDLRKRSKKDPTEVKALSTKNLEIELKENGPLNYKKMYPEYIFYERNINGHTFWLQVYKAVEGGYYMKVLCNEYDEKAQTGKWNFTRNYSYKDILGMKKDGYLKFEVNAISKYYNLQPIKHNQFDYEMFVTLSDWQKAVDEHIAALYESTNKRSADYQMLEIFSKFYREFSDNWKKDNISGPRDADSYNYKLADLNTDGMSPTYQKLDDYGPLILKKSNGKSTKVGDGFDATEKLLIDKVIANWESVKPLAKHLKADTERQSAFNVWYWLQENVRYNYDAEGKEEIRDPARTWKDRKRGVDCDCLAVFTYCLLLAMGYRPKFEIVAFMGKNTWAHIYVNLNGLAVDRVLATFGRRPALISKTKMLEVPVYSLSGPSCLEGLADTVLKKIENGTATAEDCCNYRKITALRNFNGHPVEQKTLAMFMPYIKDIDLTDGSIYFMPDYQKLAEVARWADSKLIQLANKQRCGLGDAEYQAELAGFFKKLGKFLATPIKAAYNTTKAAVKSTVNAVSATYNTVKAGVQAVTGNTEGAKESIQKAGTQLKDAVVDPIKTEVKNNVEAVRVTVDLVKVLLVKINPVTVLMRNALRALVAINFLGIANRLYLGFIREDTSSNAPLLKEGYTQDEIDRAVKAFKRVFNFYGKMGGDTSKIVQAIVNGNKRKALFKGDYKDTQTINSDDTLSGLGEPVTIGSCLAAVGAFFAKIWSWVKDIIPKGVQWIKDHKEIINTVTDVVKTVTNKNGSNSGTPETTVIEDNTNTTEKESSKSWLLWVAGGLVMGAAALSGDKKGKKRK